MSAHSVDDDVVTIVADCGHSADATHPENSTETGVEFAHEWAKIPDTPVEAVVDEHGKLRNHHAHVGKCQVDDKHIGWSFQIFCFRKEMQNQSVA